MKATCTAYQKVVLDTYISIVVCIFKFSSLFWSLDMADLLRCMFLLLMFFVNTFEFPTVLIAGSESHFKVLIVSDNFIGMSLIDVSSPVD
jgi:hypothetical protein